MDVASTQKRIKAILYDLDGVITNTRKWHYSALNKALDKFGLSISLKEQKSIYEGLPTTEKLKILTKRNGLAESYYEEIIKIKYDEITKFIKKFCAPDLQKIKLLKEVKFLGIKQVLCTNTTKSTVEIILRKMCLIDYFDFYLTRQDINFPKPHPEIFLKAMKRLNLSPHQCLIIEDSDHGIKAAEETGAVVLRCKDHEWLTIDNLKKHLK